MLLKLVGKYMCAMSKKGLGYLMAPSAELLRDLWIPPVNLAAPDAP
jgi:hypothetical protein